MAPTPRPLPKVGVGCFSLTGAQDGLPRPKYRKVSFVNPFSGTRAGGKSVLPQSADGGLQDKDTPGTSRREASVGDFTTGAGSLRQQDDSLRRLLARKWVDVAETLRADSEVLQKMPSLAGDQLLFLFMDRAASTLQRHMIAWRQWSMFARASEYSAGAPSLEQLLDFLGALSIGASSDRGSARKGSAKEKVRSLRFLAYNLALTALCAILSGPVVEAWLAGDKWDRRPAREALPLPLSVVARLEKAIDACHSGDAILIGCVLLMVWGGLRWSDVQRLKLASLVLDAESLRAWTWRSKTSVSGFPFGVLLSGATNNNWGTRLGKILLQIRADQPQRDFVMASSGKPMGYAVMLAQLRRCLVAYGGLSVTEARRYSLHSCKTTTLSWALQLSVRQDWKAAQGHHKLKSDCVVKYGRDDVLPQLRCQESILRAIWRGFVPVTPLQRGVAGLRDDPQVISALIPANANNIPVLQSVDTESESDEESRPREGDNLPLEDDEEDLDSDGPSAIDVEDADVLEDEGPWVVNATSGVFHKAVLLASDAKGLEWKGRQWGRACHPRDPISTQNELVHLDPFVQGFQRCGHSGCYAHLG